MEKILGYGALALATVALVLNLAGSEPTLSGIADASCSVSSTETATVGDDISSTVLSAASNRAYARIQIIDAETNAISLSFDEGAAAVANQGAAIGSTTRSYIEVGRNADFPYTGAVTGITDVSTTTLLITDCLY